jgi:hypothetical protein
MDTTVNLATLTGVAVELLAPVVLAIVTAAGARLFGWLGLQKDAAVRAAFDQAAARAIDYAKNSIKARPGLVIDTRSEAIATAARYVEDAVPGALNHFGITPERLKQMIEARW